MLEAILFYQKKVTILESSIKSLQKSNITITTVDLQLQVYSIQNKIKNLRKTYQKKLTKNNSRTIVAL